MGAVLRRMRPSLHISAYVYKYTDIIFIFPPASFASHNSVYILPNDIKRNRLRNKKNNLTRQGLLKNDLDHFANRPLRYRISMSFGHRRDYLTSDNELEISPTINVLQITPDKRISATSNQ